MTLKLKKNIYSILIFFIIFAFPLLPFLNSVKIVSLYVIMLFLFKNSMRDNIRLFFKKFSRFFFIYYFVFLYTFVITILFSAYDFSLTGRVISSFFLYFISFTFFQYASQYIKVEKVVVYCFVIQSIIIILSMFSESIFSMLEPFRKVDAEKELSYGRLRGNAVCGYQFFGISTMYTFVITYLILHLKKIKYGVSSLILLCIAGITSGRISILGIIIGFGILLFKKIVDRKIGQVIWISLSITIVIVISVFLLYKYVDYISDPLMYNVVTHYLIDPINSIVYDGSFESSSTNTLMEMYDKNDIKQYFLWGSGQFQLENGGYFGGVDIGYYRMLGYYGVLGFLLITYTFYYLIYRTHSNLDIYTKHAFFICFIALNFKGDVQVFNNNIIPILVAFLFFSSSNKAKELVTRN